MGSTYLANIGIHTFEPAISHGNTSTSAGGGDWLSSLIHFISDNEDYRVFWIHGEDNAPRVPEAHRMTLKRAADECDVIIMPWRWAMPNYPERHQKHLDQMWLLEHAKGQFIIHDEDHMITEGELKMLQAKSNVMLTAPELLPRDGFKQLLFPYPFDDPRQEEFLTKWDAIVSNAGRQDFTYIGNNYNRFDQAAWFFSTHEGMSPFMSIEFYGNWLEVNNDRETPEQVISAFPNVIFKGRLPQEYVIKTLKRAVATVALHKPSYGPTGFMTIRWAEAIAANCLLFVPKDFKMPLALKSLFTTDGLIVENAKELTEAYDYIVSTKARYIGTLTRQYQLVRGLMSHSVWGRLIKEAYYNGR